MSEGPLGGPRPFVGMSKTISIIFSGKTQRSMKLKETVESAISVKNYVTQEDIQLSLDEGNTVVDVGISEDSISLSELEDINDRIESRVIASDLPYSGTLEIVVR